MPHSYQQGLQTSVSTQTAPYPSPLPTEGYRAGIGYTIYRQEKEIARGSLPHTPTASTIDIEVSAINEALRQASACKAPTDRRLIVVCDSLEAVINATSARPPALTVQKALETAKWWERLIGLPVQYHWAKAHSGLLGNEQADRLAKQGAQQPGRPIGGVTLAWAQQQAKDWPTQESARRWHLEAPTRYVELAIQPAPRKGPKELQIARSSLARLVAARTGHGDFAAYRQRFAFADGDNSRNRCSCGALKKPEHFFYCRIARRRYGGPTGPPRRLCPEYLLGDPEGASHFDAWIRKTKFYQEICPTWRREAGNAVLEAADEAEDDGLQDAALEGSVALREGRGWTGQAGPPQPQGTQRGRRRRRPAAVERGDGSNGRAEEQGGRGEPEEGQGGPDLEQTLAKAQANAPAGPQAGSARLSRPRGRKAPYKSLWPLGLTLRFVFPRPSHIVLDTSWHSPLAPDVWPQATTGHVFRRGSARR